MVALQIRDVPDEVRDALAQRAARSGQSLQGFLLGIVMREAEFAQNVELLTGLDWTSGSGITGEDVLDALTASRAERPGAP